MFRRKKSLHIGTDLGNDPDGSEVTADTRSGLENGKFLLTGSGERKNEFFKLCFPGFQVFMPKLSETTFPNWILETMRQFCKRFFSLDIKQVSLKR